MKMEIKNYTKIDNKTLEWIISSGLNGTEISILLYVIRKTVGYGKSEDWISISQFELATKKSKRFLISCLTSLVNKRALVKKTALGKRSIYKLPKRMVKTSELVNKTAPVLKKASTSEQNSTQLVNKTAPTKENIQKIILQKKEVIDLSGLYKLSEKDFQEIAQRKGYPLSFVRSKYDDLVGWAEERPNNPKLKGRVWKRTLENWVKRDGLKIKQDYAKNDKRAIDASNL